MSKFGFVTDSPLFDDPSGSGFYRPLTHEEDIRLRASAQRATEVGRPMTIAEMYGGPQQLFTTLQGLKGHTVRGLAGLGAMQENSKMGSKLFITIVLLALLVSIFKS